MPHFVRVCLIALLLALPLAARAKDDLVIGLSQYPTTLHPNIEAMMAKTYVLGMAVRPLTAFDPQWHLVCMLCERLPTFENGLAKRETGPDGRAAVALTYTLRTDAFWADGVPVSTKDVAFTWEMGRHPLSGVADAELFRRIVKIDILDAKSFTVHLDRLSFDYNALNDFIPVPAHVEAPRFAAAPAEYRNRNGYDQDSANPGLYNGPYRITGVSQGSHLTLEPNPYWRGSKPAFRRIIVRAIENTPALEAQILSGGVDMVPGELGLPLEQATVFAKRNDPRFDILFKSGLVYTHMDVNLSSPILADQRVRQALMYGMDRDLINRQLFDGRQPVADTSVNPLDGVHATDIPAYAYDPVKAAQLLDEAGWKLSGGVRRDAKGEPLVLVLMTTAGNRSRELLSQVIQGQWRRLGIDARLKTEPARVFFGDTVTKRRFPHLALFAWISSPESVPRTILHSSQIPSATNNWTGQNSAGYANPRMDALLDAIEVELDKDKRTQLWRDFQQLYAEELPALPLFFGTDATILPKALKGVVPTGHQDPSTLWVEDWSWQP